jgi:hypothetical protein
MSNFIVPHLRRRIFLLTLFFVLAAIEGAVVLAYLFQDRSMERNAWLFGFSALRLGLGGGIALVILFFVALAICSVVSRGWAERLVLAIDRNILGKGRGVVAVAVWFYLLSIIAVLFFTFNSPLTLHLGTLNVIFQRLEFSLIWLSLLASQSLVLLALYSPYLFRFPGPIEPQQKLEITEAVLAITAFLAIISTVLTFVLRVSIFQFASILLLIAVGSQILRVWFSRNRANAAWYQTIVVILNAATIFCLALILYRMTTLYVESPNSPNKAYFNLLADAWLHRRLYLVDPPSTHDLTFFNGNWYVANPPLVALIMLPVIGIFGLPAMNTVFFLVFFAAFNVALVYVLLEAIAARGWTPIRRGDILWLTILFGFGTVHWYMGVDGTMWKMSQILTVTCLAISILLAVLRKPPVYWGIALGLAIVARPNVAVLGIFLLGIAIQNAHDEGKTFRVRSLVRWALQVGIPVVVAIAGLLYYNWLRFGNVLDYGYMTENVAEGMGIDLKAYGTFHPHFILRNMRIMMFGVPKWSSYCNMYLPSVQGLSIWLVTPALIFLAGSFRRKAWVVGAWAGVVATIIPLAMYYNTGAWQFGYKYLLDFLLPIMLLLAVAVGKRMHWMMKVLILISIAVNAYGVLWWFGVVCRG